MNPATDSTITLESTHRRRNGDEFPMRISATLQFTARRSQVVIVIIDDITLEKAWHSEEEVARQARA